MSDNEKILQDLTARYQSLSPQLKQAATHVLDAPADIAIHSMRRVAADADVAPSTMLRLVNVLGFESYDAFRKTFQDAMRDRGRGFGARARSLQRAAAGAGPFDGMAAACMTNLEAAFHDNDRETFAHAAALIRGAPRVFVLGAGGGFSLAHHFHYVGSMAVPNMHMPEGQAGILLDDMIDLNRRDVAIAMTFKPYTRATIDAAEFVRERGAKLISITDSRTSPLAYDTAALLLVGTQTPQFFPSYTSAMAVLETLLAHIVVRSDKEAAKRIGAIEKFRRETGVYWETD